jgi:hypothetical protein
MKTIRYLLGMLKKENKVANVGKNGEKLDWKPHGCY